MKRPVISAKERREVTKILLRLYGAIDQPRQKGERKGGGGLLLMARKGAA